MRFTFPSLLALLMGLFVTVPDLALADQRYNRPMLQGHRLDWCREWGTNCGKPAADAYCRRRGHPRSTGFQIEHDIGNHSPTRVISSGQICNGGFCDGFRYVDCAGGGGTGSGSAARFDFPRIDGYRLDWCREWAANCGQPAANAYCRKFGFNRASRFAIDHDIGSHSPTKVISSGQICNGGFCDGFRFIECRGGNAGGQTQRRFVAPKIAGTRLDWCREWGTNCGEPAATAFCRQRGFNRSVSHVMARDIGASTPTRVISSGQICNQAFCDGFAEVVCGP